MKRKDLPFQDWGKRAIAEGRKTLTSRCSGLAAVNRKPDMWDFEGMDEDEPNVAHFCNGDGSAHEVCRCPWLIGVDYDGVTVTEITAKRVQDMTESDLANEGFPTEWCDCGLPDCGNHKDGKWDFIKIWDSIHRRDLNNRHSRNPWTWRMTIKPTEKE